MHTYVALLRGIGPVNPNMHPAKLREAFKAMGFTHVRTVIASGNVVFESASEDETSLERKIERNLPKHLGFTSTTIVRSKSDIEKLLRKDPVKEIVRSKDTYLLVVFLKQHHEALRSFPKESKGVKALGIYKRELCISIDRTDTRTVNVMTLLEKTFSKEITTRTWGTVERIVKKMNEG